MTKPYYITLWEKTKPLWLEEGELCTMVNGEDAFCMGSDGIIAKLEYFEREGEGGSYREPFVAAMKKMD